MKKLILSIMCTGYAVCMYAQTKPTTAPTPPMVKEEKPAGNAIPFNPDASVATEHVTTIKGQKVPFVATTGTMPVWDEDGKPSAGIFYTYYERSDVKDRANRPLVISFNGGPGSA
jgi:carboxypeptidase C (cathepsin A)